MPHTIETIRARDYERFEANRRFEEMTDIAERLGYPIDTTIEYEMKHGAAHCRTDNIDRPFHNQTLQALLRGETTFIGDEAFEVERLRLEHEEALLVDAFGRGELDGNVLIKFSKVPDAVAEGRTGIKGYRRDLLRSFVRVYQRSPGGVECRLFTLDHSSPAGLRAVGELLDMDLMEPSEQVLAAHALVNVTAPAEFVGQLVERAKLVYDVAREVETGERSHAGSRFVDRQNAMAEIMRQPRLVDQHMQAIADIMSLGRDETALERERRNTAAAIKLVSEGADITTSADSSVADEVASGNYGRECATGSAAMNGMNQTQAMNMENIWTKGECQVCFAKTMVGSCRVCATCAHADDLGVDLLKLREKNLRSLEHQRAFARTSFGEAAPTPRQRRAVRHRQPDEKVRSRQRIVIGGAVTELYDAKTGEIIREA